MFNYDVPLPTSYEVAEVVNCAYEDICKYELEINEETIEPEEVVAEKKESEKKVKPLDKINITSGYTGPNKTRTYKYNGKYVTDHHYGVDLTGGTKIYAVADGKVVKVVNTGSNGGTMCQVRIQHKDYQSAYYHCKSGSIRVKKGQYVKKGEWIATVGNTGKSTGKHLHFQIDKGSNATSINPTAYAKGNKELKGLTKPNSDDWEPNKDYKLLKEKYLRTSPEVTATNKYKYKNLTPSAKEKCFQDKLGYARYKIGAIVNIKEFTDDKNKYVWGRTNTLWVCVQDNTGNQVEKV